MITYLRRAWSVRDDVFEELRNIKKAYPNESTLQALVRIIHSKIRVLDIVEKARHKYPLKIAGNYYAAFLEVLHNIRTCEKIDLPPVPKRGKEINFHVILLELAEWCYTQAELQKKSIKQKTVKKGGKQKDNMKVMSQKSKSLPIRNIVFICYACKDKRWLNDLQTHLKPCIRNRAIKAWSDEHIQPGSKWFPEIQTALASTKVAVLLVTPNFLASDFIHDYELCPFLKEAENGGVRIIWVPIRACAYKKTPLKDYQAVSDADRPLANMKAERDKTWVKICEEIEKAANLTK